MKFKNTFTLTLLLLKLWLELSRDSVLLVESRLMMLKPASKTLKKLLMISLVLLRTLKPKIPRRSLKDLNFWVKVSRPFLMLFMLVDLLNKKLLFLLLNLVPQFQLCLIPRALLSMLEKTFLLMERISIRKLKLPLMIGIPKTLVISVIRLVKFSTDSLLVT